MPYLDLRAALRKFVADDHIKNLLHDGDWQPMYDDRGNLLEGIRGKMGAIGLRANEEEFGADLIEMEPGSAFPLHVHPGDHILYVLEDSVDGIVHVDGVDYVVRPGDSIFIPADYPHGVKTFTSDQFLARAPGPLRFLAVGVPHKHVSSTERMRIVDPNSHSHG